MGEMLLNGIPYGTNGIRELTQSQYDALPSSKLTDGILYCIKDEGIVEGDQYAPVIYSLAEREIGVWTDGKPLYQKVIAFNSEITVSPSSWTTTDIDSTDIDCIILALASYRDGTCYGTVMADPTDSNHTKLALQCCRNGYNIFVKSLILQYTKTTDVPGSGSWGTDGVPMVHYDGNEKIVGTWFGETLYQKTIDCGNLPNATVATTAHSISNLDKIVSYSGFACTSAHAIIPLPYVNLSNISNYSVQMEFSSTNIVFQTNYNFSSYHAYVTIQYTKSS